MTPMMTCIAPNKPISIILVYYHEPKLQYLPGIAQREHVNRGRWQTLQTGIALERPFQIAVLLRGMILA